MDMLRFHLRVKENLPDAQLVFDKFHLVQSLNKTLDGTYSGT